MSNAAGILSRICDFAEAKISNAGRLVDLAISRIRESEYFEVGVCQTVVDWLT